MVPFGASTPKWLMNMTCEPIPVTGCVGKKSFCVTLTKMNAAHSNTGGHALLVIIPCASVLVGFWWALNVDQKVISNG
jgi:hypothetical protein